MKITKAVIPVAGLGSRFLPVTKTIPKAMLPIISKPAIEYIVEEAIQAGIKQFFLIVDHRQKSLEDYFDYNLELEHYLKRAHKEDRLKRIKEFYQLADFVFIRQPQPQGNGDAILQAEKFIKDEPYALMFGDDLIDSATPCLKQLMNVFAEHEGPVIAVQSVSRKEIKHFGCAKVKKLEERIFQVEELVEKPAPESAPSDLAVVGRYILTPQLIAELKSLQPPPGKEKGITDALRKFLEKSPVYACQFEGNWYTCGDELGFLKANLAWAWKDQRLKKGLKDFLSVLPE